MKPTSGKRSVSVKGHPRLTVLYDGWSLACAPESPAAFHLLEVFSALPDGIAAWVALPANRPGWTPAVHGEVGSIEPIFEPVPDTPAGRLHWEQRVLGRLARAGGAALIHTTTPSPPLAAPCPVVVSLVDADLASAKPPPAGLAGRMRAALGQGGLNTAAAILWPDDLPAPSAWPARAQRRVTAFAHEVFAAPQPRAASLPENYVLAPGPIRRSEMDFLTAAWSWAHSGLEDDWVLLAAGLEEAQRAQLQEHFRAADLAGSLAFASPTSLAELAALYQQAGCVLLAGDDAPWGSAVLRALAAGCPLAAQEHPRVDTRVGPAGYLTPPGDARALGAAVLTIIVEESVGDALREKARERVEGWTAGARGDAAFRADLARVYAEVTAVPGS